MSVNIAATVDCNIGYRTNQCLNKLRHPLDSELTSKIQVQMTSLLLRLRTNRHCLVLDTLLFMKIITNALARRVTFKLAFLIVFEIIIAKMSGNDDDRSRRFVPSVGPSSN